MLHRGHEATNAKLKLTNVCFGAAAEADIEGELVLLTGDLGSAGKGVLVRPCADLASIAVKTCICTDSKL